MRPTRYLLTTLALLAAAGCARTDRITAPERTAAPRANDATTSTTSTIPTPPDSLIKGDRNGMIGSGG